MENVVSNHEGVDVAFRFKRVIVQSGVDDLAGAEKWLGTGLVIHSGVKSIPVENGSRQKNDSKKEL